MSEAHCPESFIVFGVKKEAKVKKNIEVFVCKLMTELLLIMDQQINTKHVAISFPQQ